MGKKIGLLLALALVAVGSVAAVDWKGYPDALKKGNIMIGAGIGPLGTPLSGETSLMPIMASVDYALPLGGMPFTIGGFAGYTTTEQSPVSFVDWKLNYTGMAFAGRLAYHPNFGSKKMDTYLALGLGYYIFTGTYSGDGAPKTDPDSFSTFYYSFNLGMHYFFTTKVGLWLELGYNQMSAVAVGLTFKL